MAEGRKQKKKRQTTSVKINTYLQVTAFIVTSGCWTWDRWLLLGSRRERHFQKCHRERQ